MFNFCKNCDCKLWSNYSKQIGECPECRKSDSELDNLEDQFNELLFSPNE